VQNLGEKKKQNQTKPAPTTKLFSRNPPRPAPPPKPDNQTFDKFAEGKINNKLNTTLPPNKNQTKFVNGKNTNNRRPIYFF
jgi:hypothetical protein